MMSTGTMHVLITTLAVIVCLLYFSSASALDALSGKKKKAHIVFLISEDPDNYEAHRTVPVFADRLREEHNFQVTVLLGNGPREAYSFSGLEILEQADLLVVFCRRLALSHHQLQLVKRYLKSGKPVIGLRTANHAFSVRSEVKNGYEAWWEFVPEILGCENKGYGPTEPGTAVAIVSGAANHPVLKGVQPLRWHSKGNLYRVAPLLDKKATVLLTGSVDGTEEPIAWTRLNVDKSRVFYTSLGYPDDFETAPFCKLLINGIYWALKREREQEGVR
jgi:type 1 glutamine amidotransferase